MRALDAPTGLVRWETCLGDASHHSGPRVVATMPRAIYVASRVHDRHGFRPPVERLAALSTDGTRLWEWDSEELPIGDRIVRAPEGFIVGAGKGCARLVMGEAPTLSARRAQRRATARRLASSLTLLSTANRFRLLELGDDAFEALVPEAERRLRAYIERSDRSPYGSDAHTALELFSVTLSAIGEVMRPGHTQAVLPLADMLRGRHRDVTARTRLAAFLQVWCDQTTAAPAVYELMEPDDGVTDDTEEATLIRSLADPGARDRLTAFVALGRLGSPAALAAVREAKTSPRPLPALRDLMWLDEVPTVPLGLDRVPPLAPDEGGTGRSTPQP